MVTIKETVIARRKKKDGTWNLKIRVTHERKVAYIETPHFVNEKQLKWTNHYKLIPIRQFWIDPFFY